MLSAAVQSTLAGIITNTFFAIGDEEIQVPYCVHRELQRPERMKSGVSGYEYDVEIAVIDSSPDAVETSKQSIRTALEALEGTTKESTAIDFVEYLGDEPDHDEESNLYTNVLRFIITTSNI
jgi:hypothetical protein